MHEDRGLTHWFTSAPSYRVSVPLPIGDQRRKTSSLGDETGRNGNAAHACEGCQYAWREIGAMQVYSSRKFDEG